VSENASNTNGHEAKGGELIEQLEETAEEIKGGLAEISATFVGPIPPPDVLQGYDEVIPGLADRIVGMAEAEGNHRRDQERRALDAEIENDRILIGAYIKKVRIGQILAFVIAVVALCLGSYVAANGYQFAGAVIGTGGLIGIVTAFIQGRRKDNPADERKKSNGAGEV